ncbi:MAG: radical SAM protein, partial [Endomicrobia bacterium]|nr:radical SAM protein [Endomicrobiia bacterium]
MNISKELYRITCEKNIPLYTFFELTYKCNLKCIHCYIPEKLKNTQEMDTPTVKKIIFDIANLGGMFIIFTGGEPLLRKDIFELINFAKKLNFVVILFTNGSLINTKTANTLAKVGVDKVEISIYGSEVCHNKFVKRKVFDKVLKGIKLLNFYNVPVCIKTVLTQYNT